MKCFVLSGVLLTLIFLLTEMSLAEHRQKPQWQSIDVEAGPIWDNDHAHKRCPEVLSAWLEANPDKEAQSTGHWTTTVECEMSVCNFRFRNKEKVAR